MDGREEEREGGGGKASALAETRVRRYEGAKEIEGSLFRQKYEGMGDAKVEKMEVMCFVPFKGMRSIGVFWEIIDIVLEGARCASTERRGSR